MKNDDENENHFPIPNFIIDLFLNVELIGYVSMNVYIKF